MCVDFVKQTTGHLNSMKRNYETGYQQCTHDVTAILHKSPEISFCERQKFVNQLSIATNRRFQPYRSPKTHHTIVNDWFNRCGGSKDNKSLPDSASERSNTSSPSSSFDEHSDRSSSLWRPW